MEKNLYCATDSGNADYPYCKRQNSGIPAYSPSCQPIRDLPDNFFNKFIQMEEPIHAPNTPIKVNRDVLMFLECSQQKVQTIPLLIVLASSFWARAFIALTHPHQRATEGKDEFYDNYGVYSVQEIIKSGKCFQNRTTRVINYLFMFVNLDLRVSFKGKLYRFMPKKKEKCIDSCQERSLSTDLSAINTSNGEESEASLRRKIAELDTRISLVRAKKKEVDYLLNLSKK
ncbi:hypothetical protein RND71_019114 [Anisodus tanguticus]|uniref:Uncharacterized protein n=1 Tax=Anisodus tanguticus TaxID=243964 RepID=A0AAE1RYV1_9SOLA|nr:hypothetical protein RND71_019114 [Anisodus tanguticus]